jgi:hypothetical protein
MDYSSGLRLQKRPGASTGNSGRFRFSPDGPVTARDKFATRAQRPADAKRDVPPILSEMHCLGYSQGREGNKFTFQPPDVQFLLEIDHPSRCISGNDKKS